MALCKRAVQSAAHFSKSVATATGSPTSLNTRLQYRCLSQQPNVKRAFLVDTLALVRGMESQGVPSKQAEAITAAITEVLNDSLENVSNSFVSTQEMQKVELLTNQEMQKSEMLQEANLSKFKSEVKSSQDHHFSMLQRETEKLRSDIEKMRSESSLMQEHHFSMLQRETEKLKSDIDKMRSELKYEIDKATAGQRLDLNLERGRIRDELANQNAETTNLTNKLDREIHALRAQLEAAKYDVIKYCVGTLASISAVGLAVIRILL